MFGIVIDKQGFKVEFVVLNEDKSPQFYELKEGEAIVEEDWQIANSMNKPQWVNDKWIDTDPLPPIEEIPQQPNEMEVLRSQLDELSEYTLLIEMKNIELEEQTTLNSEYALDLDTRLIMLENKQI